MISAVDSSVILDVLTNDPDHAHASERLLRRAIQEGRLVACECVLAEIFPAIGNPHLVDKFLRDIQLEYDPMSREAALLAGQCYNHYLRRGGTAHRVLADFLIGAHARLQADRLLARDRGYLRDYFSGLRLLQPA